MKNLDLIYIATNGFAVRMILQTNLLKTLSDSGIKIGLITGDSNDPTVNSYCLKNNIENIDFEIPKDKNLKNYELFRRYFVDNVEENPALKEKHLRLKDSSKTFRSKINFHFLNFIKTIKSIIPFKKKILKFVDKKYLVSQPAINILNNFNPKLIISTYPVNYIDSVFLFNSTELKNTKSVIHLLSWDNITCKGKFKSLANYYIVWGKIMKDELIKYYNIPEKEIFITGVPHFDLHKNINNEFDFKTTINKLGLDSSKPYIFFGMSSPYFAPKEIEIVSKIAGWINENKWNDLQLVIRPHPQNVKGEIADLNWIDSLKSLKSKRVAVDFPILNDSKIPWSMEYEDMLKLYGLIYGSSIVLNSCSTISIDGLNFNKPVIITAFDNEESLPWHISVKRVMEYEHFNKLINSNSVFKVNNYQELEESITLLLNNPDINKYEKIRFIEQECYKIDGKSTERVANVIENLIKLQN